MPLAGGFGFGNPSLVPPGPHARSHESGQFAQIEFLYDPRAVRFGTALYLVLLQHWTQLRWVKQWRQGKAVVSGVNRGTVVALPRPICDPGCQPSYEGLIPGSRTAKAAAVAANVAKLAAQLAPTASAEATQLAPTPASHFRDAMGAVQAAGTSFTFEVWCLFVSLNF